MCITVQFELRKNGKREDSGLMQFSDVHTMNKYIREECYPEFWFVAKSAFIWSDLPPTVCMDLEEDKFAIKGMDWQLGKSYNEALTYHLVGV